ncbi:MAG: hypothetical protein JXB05_28940 [Myxococcaceae bacterium]|nr:hypothetical protein [Myxococcaceae bacterium]
MPKLYFKLRDDIYRRDRWELGTLKDATGTDVDSWMLKRGQPVESGGPLSVPIDRPGPPMDFSFASFDLPVVHARVATLRQELAPSDVQLLPVKVASQREKRYVLNVLRTVKCIDDAACSEVQYYAPGDMWWPERAGEYRAVHGLRIDPSKVGDAQVFRPWGWPVVILVSEDIKSALERIGATGTVFTEV